MKLRRMTMLIIVSILMAVLPPHGSVIAEQTQEQEQEESQLQVQDPNKRLMSSVAAYDGHTVIKCRGRGGDYPGSFRSQLDHDHPAIL